MRKLRLIDDNELIFQRSKKRKQSKHHFDCILDTDPYLELWIGLGVRILVGSKTATTVHLSPDSPCKLFD